MNRLFNLIHQMSCKHEYHIVIDGVGKCTKCGKITHFKKGSESNDKCRKKKRNYRFHS